MTEIAYIDQFCDGKWIKVPSVNVNGRTVVVTGNPLKTAAFEAEFCLETEVEDPEGCLRILKEYRNLGADIFTFAQRVPAATRKYTYPLEWESVAAIRLTNFSDWWDKLPQETRKNCRRASKRGVVVRREVVDDDLVRGIVQINNETPVRQGKQFTHFGESFDKVKKDFLSFEDRSDLLCAFFAEELIGFIKIVHCKNLATIAKLQVKIRHADKRPANALMASALQRCEEKGASYVTYGQYRYGNQTRTSLMEFKSRHGFEEVLVPRYYVPLTIKGKLAMTLKLHRGLVGILPPRAVRIGRAIRAKWLERHSSKAGVAQG